MLNEFNRKDVSPLRYWVHAILPLVYDDSLSYYEVLAKVSDKMNEVISGLNRNNEQVEKVTQFTTEQVQNLTAAFNNFQESMLTRQGEFENTLLEEQNSFEARLDGEIAQWEENTTEHFNQMYQDFLSAYQRQFGVVQTTGDSTTDVMSQDASTKLLFNTPIYVNPTNYQTVLPDLNTADYNGIYLLIFANGTTQENLPANLPFDTWVRSTVRVLFNLIPASSRNGAVQLLYDPQTGTWYYRYHGTDTYGIWYTDATKNKFGIPLYVQRTNYTSVLPDLNTADYNGIYLLNFANGTTQENLPANLPFTTWTGSRVRVLFNLLTTSSRVGSVQLLYEPQTGDWYYRYHDNNEYGEWVSNAVSSKFGKPIYVNPSNYQTVLPDLNTADYSGVYLLVFANGTTQENLPANLPFDTWVRSTVRVLFNLLPDSSRAGAVQLLYEPQTGTWYYRYHGQTSYGVWYTDATKNKFGVPLYVQPTNYESVLPDLNTADYNGIYLLNFANGTTQENLPANLPFNTWVRSTVRVLFNLLTTSRVGAVQMLYDPQTGDWYYRYHDNNEYGEWRSPNKPKTITVSKTGGDYSSILVAVLNSKSYDTIIVEKGEYDLEQEFKDYYGDDFFDNFDASSPKGIYLGNHIHLIFSSDALVKFNYEGNNSAVFENFSPFLSSTYGFTLENLTLTASRCRYCIHDERGTTKDSYKNVYLNCNLTIDNKELDNRFRQCIGGGLGYAGEIIIKDCVFNSIAEQPFETLTDVSYHNSKQDNAKSNIVISGCYFNNRLRFSWYGESTKVSTMLATNNRFGGSIIERAETSEYDNRNTQVIAFNNVIE